MKTPTQGQKKNIAPAFIIFTCIGHQFDRIVLRNDVILSYHSKVFLAMGHIMVNFVEVKHKNGKWIKTGPIFPRETFTEANPIEFTDEPFSATNYELYALFGSVMRQTLITPIATLKGLPEDSEFLNSVEDGYLGAFDGQTRRTAALQNDIGFHFSYMLLSELLVVEERKAEYLGILGDTFFIALELMKSIGGPSDVRLIYWFA